MERRQLGAFAAVTLLGLAGQPAFAQTYPDKPIRMIVPFAPGGGTDTVARIVMKKVSESIGQPIIIDNKGGAGGTLGWADAARSKSDGYTITMGSAHLSLVGLIYEKLPFDPGKDLVSVAPLAGVPIALVAGPAVAAKTMSELIASAKSNASTPLAYGTPGIATPNHMAGVLLATTAGVPLTHVPYKGSAPAMQDVMGGQIALAVVGLSTALPFARGGQVKVLGVGGAKRSSLAPDIPTIAEGGVKGYEAGYWYDVTAPKGVPKAISDRLHSEITKAVQSADVRDALMKAGFEPLVMTPAENERALKEEATKWSKVIRENGIRATN